MAIVKLENPTTPATTTQTTTSQFLFPKSNSKQIPDPSKYFSSTLLSSPLPTTSFFTNFIVGNGDQPSFIHPYLIKLSLSSLSLSYPSISSSSSSISQTFSPDLTISTPQSSTHFVSSFSDLTVTVDFSSSDFRFILARGCPYITLEVSRTLPLCFSTKCVIQSISSSTPRKHKIELQNKQIWVIYSSSDLIFNKKDDTHFVSSKVFSGVVRIAILPEKKTQKNEEILDLYSNCYPVNGEAIFATPFSLDYKWEIKGWGDQLLMLAHPLHLKLISAYNSGIRVLDNYKYKSIDGDLVAIIGNQWSFRVTNVPISWHSNRGISEENYPEIVNSLWKDVGSLNSFPITTTNSYHYSTQVARVARLGLIAEEINCMELIPAIKMFLREYIEPWLMGNFEKNGFLYDEKWGGIVCESGSDYGFDLYNNHHFTLGYFVFSIAVLAKFDVEWGIKFKGHAYALVASYMNLGKNKERLLSKYTKLRSFVSYMLHSWTNKLHDKHTRNSEIPSASINAYYSASLLGLVYGDDHLVSVGSTLSSFEIEAVKTWWHVKEGGVYGGEFSKKNKMVGLCWEYKREGKLWFTLADNKECRVGIQMIPIMPMLSEILFSDVGFARDVVEWASPSMGRKEATDSWKGFVYALEAMYDHKNALEKIRGLKGFHEGNSMSNMLWWVYSIVGKKNVCSWCKEDGKDCWFCNHCC